MLKNRKSRARVRAVRGSRADLPYMDAPATAVVVQFFNKAANIEMLARGLDASGAHERIVLEDGSSDNSLGLWAEHLTRGNDFIIRSSDLFEVRTYERALRFTRAPVVALLQDDDELPSTSAWLDEAVRLFAVNARLAVLGGLAALNVLPLSPLVPGGTTRPDIFQYTRDALRVGEDFRYVMAVNRAPMILRREAVLAIGGIDQAFAPFQCDDVDLCLRLWESGWHVGLYNAHFPRRNVGEGGMRLFNSHRVQAQSDRNWPKVYERHAKAIQGSDLRKIIAGLNEGR